MMEIGLETKLGWELGKTFAGVHLDAPILTTLGVRRFERSFVSRAMESEKLVETVSHAAEHALSAADDTYRPTSFASISVRGANDLLGNLHHSIEDVADGTAQFTGRSVLGSRRRLNITVGNAAEAQKSCCENQFFHNFLLSVETKAHCLEYFEVSVCWPGFACRSQHTPERVIFVDKVMFQRRQSMDRRQSGATILLASLQVD
jgi:hypothetical protein